MTGRSLRATPEGIQKLRKAIKLNDWKQAELKDELGLKTRQPITRLLAGEAIERSTFEELCHLLNLSVEEIAASEVEQAGQVSDISALVSEIRSQIDPQIRQQCGTMRVLDMTQPIALTGDNGIYTSVNILEKLTGRRRLELPELLEQCDLGEFDRFGLSHITEKRVPGLDAATRYPKLMVLGKPGAGKTTFLKYLAMQCIEGQFAPDRVPMFVTLKDFAETKNQPDLVSYLGDRMAPVLAAGKVLILLDGLDEVRRKDTKRIIRQIEQFAEQFHANSIVITCRIAAKEYSFGQFTEVEIADFNDEQINTFARNWFRAKGDGDRANLFWQKLVENQPIKELATSPLLLTLLCLIFGEKGALPEKRHKVYREGMNLLLEHWDTERGVNRDIVYRNLSLQQRKDLLSKIALHQFERQQYFFEPETIEKLIANFLCQSIDNDFDSETNGKTILKSIEAHHGLLVERAKGIYSFSHLTFQEYFAAREITKNQKPEMLQQVVNYITKPRWREVFLLTVSMMQNADEWVGLMQQQIDGLLTESEEFQKFLTWVQQKSSSVNTSYKPAAVRAFYLAHARDLTHVSDLARDLAHAHDLRVLTHDHDFDRSRNLRNLTHARDLTRTLNLDLDLALNLAPDLICNCDLALDLDLIHALDIALVRALAHAYTLDLDLALAHALDTALVRALSHTNALKPNSDLQRKVQRLRDQLSNETWENRENFKPWQRVNGEAWTRQLRTILIKHRNIGHDWQFKDAPKKRLQQYHKANKLLLDCLNNDSVSREVRQEIEETLLLPMSEIEKRRKAASNG